MSHLVEYSFFIILLSVKAAFAGEGTLNTNNENSRSHCVGRIGFKLSDEFVRAKDTSAAAFGYILSEIDMDSSAEASRLNKIEVNKTTAGSHTESTSVEGNLFLKNLRVDASSLIKQTQLTPGVIIGFKASLANIEVKSLLKKYKLGGTVGFCLKHGAFDKKPKGKEAINAQFWLKDINVEVSTQSDPKVNLTDFTNFSEGKQGPRIVGELNGVESSISVQEKESRYTRFWLFQSKLSKSTRPNLLIKISGDKKDEVLINDAFEHLLKTLFVSKMN